MDKKYNGFNNGRDKSDGVGGREVNHGTQETMTKEQTAVEFIIEMIDNMVLNGADLGEDLPPLLVHIKRAKEIEQQQLSAERERAGKLEHALKMCVDVLKGLDATDYVAYTAGKVALIEYQKES